MTNAIRISNSKLCNLQLLFLLNWKVHKNKNVVSISLILNFFFFKENLKIKKTYIKEIYLSIFMKIYIEWKNLEICMYECIYCTWDKK